jgi:hypothetical protein
VKVIFKSKNVNRISTNASFGVAASRGFTTNVGTVNVETGKPWRRSLNKNGLKSGI